MIYCSCAETFLFILEIPVHAQINYILGVFCALAAGWLTALKFIMAAFDMSVGDSLCKTSTTDREGGQEDS